MNDAWEKREGVAKTNHTQTLKNITENKGEKKTNRLEKWRQNNVVPWRVDLLDLYLLYPSLSLHYRKINSYSDPNPIVIKTKAYETTASLCYFMRTVKTSLWEWLLWFSPFHEINYSMTVCRTSLSMAQWLHR